MMQSNGRSGRVAAAMTLILLVCRLAAAGRAAATPGQGYWQETADMAYSRSGHTATLLLDGRVLVAGGNYYSAAATADAELYDPALGQWSPCLLYTSRCV